jgi:HTH-type transcriptional regulator/antitoxin HipB
MKLDTIQAFRVLVLARRAELDLSQAAAATKAGVSRKWLSDFESGKETVELGKVLALLEALGVVLTVATPTENADGDLDAFLQDYQSGD